AGVRYVDIDEESIRRIGQWPWPRTTMARLTTTLRDAHAAVIAYDATFPEPDRTSPELIAANLPRGSEWDVTRTQLAALPSNDKAFADALRSSPSVLGFILTDRDTGRGPVLKKDLAVIGDAESKPINAMSRFFRGATVSLDLLQQAARGNGSFNT